MLYFCKDKKDCTGCSACQQSCPINCISMIEDPEGFVFPVASNACIHCGKCERVCPIINSVIEPCENQKEVFAGKTKDYGIWKRSASGGAFSEICKAWNDITKNCIFIGAAWDGLDVKHEIVDSLDRLSVICKSKYVSSSIGDVFISVRHHLLQGKGVVFCGTPCQVAGLKSFLGKQFDSPNLLTIDLICHGVGSPKVFKTAIACLESQFGRHIISYEFRSKRKKYETDYLCKITFADGKESYVVRDQYMQLFLSQNALRSSCGKNCIFRNENRVGDITIADFKGLIKVFPELKGYEQNYSTIVLNNDKAKRIQSQLYSNMEMKKCSIDDIKKYNPLFYRQTKFSETRDDFFRDYVTNNTTAVLGWTKAAQQYKPGFFKIIYSKLPLFARKLIYSMWR